MNKHDIRKTIIDRRNALSSDNIKKSSTIIINKISKIESFLNARTILFYYPFRNEVDLLPLMNKCIAEKKVCLPRIEKEDGIMSARLITDLKSLKKDKYGILSPQEYAIKVSLNDIDLVIVPLVAFDRELNRIGYGGGYYDRFLKKCNATIKMGVAYFFQEIDEIIANSHDVKLDLVVTDI